MDIQKLFDQQSEINERAWDTFTSEYERRNPPPQVNEKWQRIGMNVGLFAAMIVSGIFTIQAFLQVFKFAGISNGFDWVGAVSGFVMIDVILFFLTNFVVNLAYRGKALAGEMEATIILKISGGIAAFIFFVSLSSNLYFMMMGFDVLQSDSSGLRFLGLIVGVMLGSAPPIQSVAIGTIVAMIPMQSLIERKSWEDSRQRAWFQFRRKHKLDLSIEDRLERLATPVHEVFMNVHEQREQAQKRTP